MTLHTQDCNWSINGSFCKEQQVEITHLLPSPASCFCTSTDQLLLSDGHPGSPPFLRLRWKKKKLRTPAKKLNRKDISIAGRLANHCHSPLTGEFVSSSFSFFSKSISSVIASFLFTLPCPPENNQELNPITKLAVDDKRVPVACPGREALAGEVIQKRSPSHGGN
ncbi:hypothetical protein LINGRAHAP2_LOCUS19395 [Linum grandiflorum]